MKKGKKLLRWYFTVEFNEVVLPMNVDLLAQVSQTQTRCEPDAAHLHRTRARTITVDGADGPTGRTVRSTGGGCQSRYPPAGRI